MWCQSKSRNFENDHIIRHIRYHLTEPRHERFSTIQLATVALISPALVVAQLEDFYTVLPDKQAIEPVKRNLDP
jgi:hypothetical protein